MARSVTPRRRAPASEVTRPPSNAAMSSRPPALPNTIPVALQCVGIGERPPSGLNSFSQNKFYPFSRGGEKLRLQVGSEEMNGGRTGESSDPGRLEQLEQLKLK